MKSKERRGQAKKFEDETEEELAGSLRVIKVAISKRLKAAGYIQKHGNCVAHELKPRDVERQCCMSQILLERPKKEVIFASDCYW